MKEVIVIGGGVVGLFSAYYLAQEGCKITILDQNDFSDGCSYGNAGMIVPSHIIPLAAPGMIQQGIKWMFDVKSPFYIEPRINLELIKWGYSFYKSATKSKVEKAMPALKELSVFSKSLYQDLAKDEDDFLYKEKGLLMLYKTASVAEEEIEAAEKAQALGLEVDFLNKSEVLTLEKGLSTDVLGGIHYKSDAHLNPNKLMDFLKRKLKEMGVVFVSNEEVIDFELENNTIKKVQTHCNQYSADEVILATGAWSPRLSKKIGWSLSLLPGKGYSFTIPDLKNKPEIPSILCEAKVAVTPIGEAVRFGGTMEITHVKNTTINTNRVKGITEAISKYYPDCSIPFLNKESIWYGYRPCSPDGLPYIGRLSKVRNILLATGHAMMGLSLAPATGKLITETILNQKTSVSLNLFNPERKF
ncbi:D-arginine dehydrogenase [Flavobacteriaceae bacterium UJ101]|nr:D-arginine dehydrogenase [Flavobacteriaceae bacterium UJ101]